MNIDNGTMQCSPSHVTNFKKYNTCFDLLALQNLARSWNITNPKNKIKNILKLSKTNLYNEIQTKMKNICGNDTGACWVANLGNGINSPEGKSIRPLQPTSWRKNHYEWLSNEDIDRQLRQYNFTEEPSYKYHFLGVFPIDFELKTDFGTCLYDSICSLNLSKVLKNGIYYIGMVTNLDKHNEPGSHWTSIFISINPSSPSFGIYYYDSITNKPPVEINNFMKRMQDQAKNLPNPQGKNFRIAFNNNRHQRGSSECGMFSTYHQILWIEKLRENPSITFEDIIKIPVDDQYMQNMRDLLFPVVEKKITRRNIKKK